MLLLLLFASFEKKVRASLSLLLLLDRGSGSFVEVGKIGIRNRIRSVSNFKGSTLWFDLYCRLILGGRLVMASSFFEDLRGGE